jgi:hypothetical protein
MAEVPTIRLENLSADQVRAYVIADNRVAEKAGWDKAILAIELQNLLTIDSDFDVTITGFEIPEIDLILTTDHGKPDPDDDCEISKIAEAVTRPGDVWQLGRHRLFCGSAIEQPSFSELLGNRRADVVFVDPPYNVAIDGNVSGNGSIRHREFGMASGEMSEFEFITFLATSLRLLARYSAAGSVHFVCMDWRHMSELLSAGQSSSNSFGHPGFLNTKQAFVSLDCVPNQSVNVPTFEGGGHGRRLTEPRRTAPLIAPAVT